MLRTGSGMRNADHFFFVVDGDGCTRLVGVISLSPLFGFACLSSSHHGLCDLSVSRLMIHGESEHSTWHYDGARYVMVGRPTLGPRPPKFR